MLISIYKVYYTFQEVIDNKLEEAICDESVKVVVENGGALEAAYKVQDILERKVSRFPDETNPEKEYEVRFTNIIIKQVELVAEAEK